MQPTQTPTRPLLTLDILLYAIVDGAGMVVFAVGAVWLTQGSHLFGTAFPSDKTQAIVATVAGVFMMFWAATKMLRKLIRRPAGKPEKAR